MGTNTEPVSRRERPAKPALTRAGIVAAAVAAMRAEGLERVTLRRLAQELDTGPASLYVYFRNGAALHAAILDELLGSVVLPAAGEPGGWTGRVVEALWSYTSILAEYPSLAQSAVYTRPSGPNYLSVLEYLLSSLEDGGVPAGQRAWAVDILLLYATALAAEHGERRHSADTAQQDDELVRAIRNASEASYPAIAVVGEDLLLSGSPRQRYEWGVRALLAGIAATPTPFETGQARNE
jgi:AcrR family transcriptional regulator